MYRIIFKSFFCVLLIITLFSNIIDNIIGIDIVKFFDEFLLFLSIFSIVLYFFIKLKFPDYFKNVFLVFISLLFISFLSPIFTKESVFQIFIHLKFFLFFIFIRIFFKRDNYILKYTFYFIIFLTLLGLFLNLIFKEEFNYFLDYDIRYRNGLLRMIGFQVSPNNLGLTFMLIYLYAIFYNNKKSFLFLHISTVLFIIVNLLIGIRTSLILIPIVYFLFTKKLYSGFLKYFTYFSLAILFSFLIFSSQNTDIFKRTVNNIIDTQNLNSGYARGLIMLNALKLSVTNFPIGSGSATYGTMLSKESPIYKQLNINANGNLPIYDSNFSSILGEFGFLGILLFIYLIVSLNKILKHETKIPYYYLSLIITIFIFSITNPVLMNGYQALLLAVVFNLYQNNISSK
tara:strand:+ start:9186 stop:10388 length:1203 start_codon:yes stop_codon:yes gene_type:complete